MKPQSLHAHEDRLLDFVYGELSAPEARVVEAHLQGCARCTQALDDIRGVRATMSQLSAEPAPDAGLESLMAYAQQSARRAAAGPEPKPSRWRRWFLPMVGLASVATFGILTLQSESSAPALGPDLTAAKLERASHEDIAPVVAQSVVPPPAASPADLPKQPPQAELVAASGARAEDWEQSGSGGGLDTRVTRSAETKRKREASKAKADSGGPPVKKGLQVKSAPAADTAPEEESYAGAEAPARGSLKVGGLSMAGRADADEADSEGLEEPSAATGLAAAPAPAEKQSTDDFAMKEAPRPTASAKPAARMKQAEGLSAYTVAPAAPPPPPRPQVAAAEPRLSSSELSRQAQEAYRAGDRDREARLLRLALGAGASGSERVGLLGRLCEAELSLGRRDAGLEACNQVLAEAPPGSSAARAARRHLQRESVNQEAPSKPASPAQ